MNWAALGFEWSHVRALLATAEEGSFSGAARVLNSTQPTVGRQVAALEDALGVVLFERTGRGPVLTDAGRELLPHVRAMGEAAARVSIVASGQSQEVAGEVVISASDLFAATMLPSILLDLRRKAPGIRTQVIASGEVQDLMRREADIAIRHVRTTQPDLIARHITDFRANLYASTAYLERRGRPRGPHDLIDHDYISVPDTTQFVGLLADRGVAIPAENIVLKTASGVVLWEALKTGLGLTIMPESAGDREPGVERVWEGFASIEFPAWLVTHRELFTSRRIRVVFDHLAEALATIR
ncbi:MAG: LysR family transcriptional regulator [Myxococcota bacterium]